MRSRNHSIPVRNVLSKSAVGIEENKQNDPRTTYPQNSKVKTMADSNKKKSPCKYGLDCYRQNSDHLNKYEHPDKNGASAAEHRDAEKREHDPEGSETSTKKAKECEIRPAPYSHRSGIHLYDPLEEAAMNALKIQLAELVKDRKKFLRQMFYVVFPDEFYEFWEFCKNMNKANPEKALEPFGLKLVGPFDVLSGKFDESPLYEPLEYLTHWRFFYDVPEFQTVMVKDKSEIHYGYWRDIPFDDQHCLVARNDSNRGCEMKMVAANMFQTVIYYLENDFAPTPFNKAQATKMNKAVAEWASSKNISLTNAEEVISQREAKVVCRTLHRGGLVAPYDRRTKIGYRPLMEDDATLKKVLEKFEKIKLEDKPSYHRAMEGLQGIITAADIAVDEKDSATALELGIDLFCSGHESLHELCKLQLIAGYSLLNRPQYIAIAKTHLQNRRKGDRLDLLSLTR